MNLIRGFFVAFSMYSKIPVPRTEWTKESMKYSMCFFPLIGVVIGALVLLVNRGAEILGVSQVLKTILLILIPIVVTGGIHLDGFLDTSDALSSYQSREDKLRILKDPNAGAFAVIMGIVYIVLSFGIWYDIPAQYLPVLVPGFVLSRALSGIAVVNFRKAKDTGLAATFAEMALRRKVTVTLVIYLIICVASMLYLDPITGAAGLGGAAISFAYYRWMSYRTFGGITGDLAGFFLQICELAIPAAMLLLIYLCK